MPIDLPVVAALACLFPGQGLAGIAEGPLGLTWHGAVIGEYRRVEGQEFWVSGSLVERRVACAQADDVELFAGGEGLAGVRWFWEGMPASVLEHRVDRVVARLGGEPSNQSRTWDSPGLRWTLRHGQAASWLVVRPTATRP